MRNKYTWLGLIVSILAALISGLAWFYYMLAGGGGLCNTYISCNIVYMFSIASLVSLVFALIFFLQFFRENRDSRSTLIVYMVTAGFFVLVGFVLSEPSPLNMILRDTTAECKFFTFGRTQDLCFDRLATKKGDINICYLIDSQTRVSSAKNSCVTDFAVRELNPDICLDQDYYCVRRVAFEAQDVKICEKSYVISYTDPQTGELTDTRKACIKQVEAYIKGPNSR